MVMSTLLLCFSFAFYYYYYTVPLCLVIFAAFLFLGSAIEMENHFFMRETHPKRNAERTFSLEVHRAKITILSFLPFLTAFR